MGFDHGDCFPFDFETNGNPFGSKSIGKLSPRSYPIQFERKWKYSFLSVDRKTATNRLIAVRETGVSRHQGGSVGGPPENPRTSQHYRIEGIKGSYPIQFERKWKSSFLSVDSREEFEEKFLICCGIGIPRIPA